MHPIRRKKLYYIVALLVVVAIVTYLMLNAFRQNMMFFYSPTEIVNGEAPLNKSIRVGGLVVHNSLERESDSLKLSFSLTDNAQEIIVHYEGILPDLFREGQGIVARGVVHQDGSVLANQVLAKHDENYMPPEVADSLKASQHTTQ